MSPSDIDDIIVRNPSQPLRLTLASRDQVILPNPERAIVSGLAIAFMTGPVVTPGSRVTQHMRMISVSNIVMIEPVEPGRNGRRRRR